MSGILRRATGLSSLKPCIVRVVVEIVVTSDTGKGRVFVLLHEHAQYISYVRELVRVLENSARVVLLEVPVVDQQNWKALGAALVTTCEGRAIRQASFLGFGAAATIVQEVALNVLKLVRTLVLVDATTRAHPSWCQRFSDRVEEFLPLGLPLRLRGLGFDGKPYLHRLRCPALVVCSRAATIFERAQAELLADRLPTAWRIELGRSDLGPIPKQQLAGAHNINEELQLAELVREFSETPARCPQRAQRG